MIDTSPQAVEDRRIRIEAVDMLHRAVMAVEAALKQRGPGDDVGVSTIFAESVLVDSETMRLFLHAAFGHLHGTKCKGYRVALFDGPNGFCVRLV